jgi:hypothetical protein
MFHIAKLSTKVTNTLVRNFPVRVFLKLLGWERINASVEVYIIYNVVCDNRRIVILHSSQLLPVQPSSQPPEHEPPKRSQGRDRHCPQVFPQLGPHPLVQAVKPILLFKVHKDLLAGIF